MNQDYTTVRKILTWVTMLNNCLHPWMVIDVLADECDEAVTNALVKYFPIDEAFGESYLPMSSPARHDMQGVEAEVGMQLPRGAGNAPSPGSFPTGSLLDISTSKEETTTAFTSIANSTALSVAALQPAPSSQFPVPTSSSMSSLFSSPDAAASKGKAKSKGAVSGLVSSHFESDDSSHLSTSEAMVKAKRVDDAVQKLLDTGKFLFNETDHEILRGAAFPRNLSGSIQDLMHTLREAFKMPQFEESCAAAAAD